MKKERLLFVLRNLYPSLEISLAALHLSTINYSTSRCKAYTHYLFIRSSIARSKKLHRNTERSQVSLSNRTRRLNRLLSVFILGLLRHVESTSSAIGSESSTVLNDFSLQRSDTLYRRSWSQPGKLHPHHPSVQLSEHEVLKPWISAKNCKSTSWQY